MIKKLTKFERLFSDEAPDFTTTPFLSDVVPGLIETDAKFASKELNPRRYAVSGRSLRSPNVRSINPEDYLEFDYENNGPINYPLFNEPSGTQSLDEYQEGLNDPDTPQSSETGNLIGRHIGKQIGLQGLLGTIGTIGGGLAAKVPGSAIMSALPGGFATSALSPAGLINATTGAAVAGLLGKKTHDIARFKGTGTQAQTEAVKSNLGLTGLIGLLGQNLASKFSSIRSPQQKAERAFNISILEQAQKEAKSGPFGALDRQTQQEGELANLGPFGALNRTGGIPQGSTDPFGEYVSAKSMDRVAAGLTTGMGGTPEMEGARLDAAISHEAHPMAEHSDIGGGTGGSDK